MRRHVFACTQIVMELVATLCRSGAKREIVLTSVERRLQSGTDGNGCPYIAHHCCIDNIFWQVGSPPQDVLESPGKQSVSEHRSLLAAELLLRVTGLLPHHHSEEHALRFLEPDT